MHNRNLWLAAIFLCTLLLSFCGAPTPHTAPTPPPSPTPLPAATCTPTPSPTPQPTPSVQLPSGATYGDRFTAFVVWVESCSLQLRFHKGSLIDPGASETQPETNRRSTLSSAEWWWIVAAKPQSPGFRSGQGQPISTTLPAQPNR